MMLQKLLGMAFLLSVPLSLAAQTCNNSIAATMPDNRFTVSGDTVTDNKTQLMWKLCLQGQSGASCSGSAGAYNWSSALQQARDDTSASYSDWRVPNINELRSIIEIRCVGPSINATIFPQQLNALVWSASPYASASNASVSWIVDFNSSLAGSNNRASSTYVRLVRNVQ